MSLFSENINDVRMGLETGAKTCYTLRRTKGKPHKKETMDTLVHGINQGINLPGESAKVFSCASCTTSCITPVVEVMGPRSGMR